MLTPVSRFLAIGLFVLLAACTNTDPNGPLPDLGDFRLGNTIVRAIDVQKGPFSRDATQSELTEALEAAMVERFVRYDGDGLYHLGLSIGGYVLAQPGLPVVYTPKSVLIFDVNVYDNTTGEKLTAKRHRITAFEGLENSAPIVGSGLTRGKEEQLANLTREGARLLQSWLIENKEWFAPKPDQVRSPFDRAAQKAKTDALK